MEMGSFKCSLATSATPKRSAKLRQIRPKIHFSNWVKSNIRLIEKKCFQFINLEKCVKYDIAKIYVFLQQNPNFWQNVRFCVISKNYFQ